MHRKVTTKINKIKLLRCLNFLKSYHDLLQEGTQNLNKLVQEIGKEECRKEDENVEN